MNLGNNIKTALKYTWQNPIVIQPFVLVLFISAFINVIVMKKPAHLMSLLSVLIFLLLSVAISVGWLYMIKKTIEFENDNAQLNQAEKSVKSLMLLKHFFPGVGEYFLPAVLFGALIFLIVSIICGLGSFLALLAKTQPLIAFAGISLLAFVTVAIFFTGGSWMNAALFYTTKNPIRAFFAAIKFGYKNIWTTIAVIAYSLAGSVISALITVVAVFLFAIIAKIFHAPSVNVISLLVQILTLGYFTTSLIMLIFLCYGQGVEQNYINSGDDSDR